MANQDISNTIGTPATNSGGRGKEKKKEKEKEREKEDTAAKGRQWPAEVVEGKVIKTS